MGLFDCASGGGKKQSKSWAKESQRPKEKDRGTSPAPSFFRSTSRMSKSSLFASNLSLGKVKTLDIDYWRNRVLGYLFRGEGKEDIRFLGVPYRDLGYVAVTDFIVGIPPEIYQQYEKYKPDERIIKDDKVIWQRDGICESGVYRWSGIMENQQVMGLQLDRKKMVPFGTHDGKGLFYCKPGHRAMVPSSEVIPYRKFLRSFLGKSAPRKESAALDMSTASSNRGNPAKHSKRGKKYKQGDHVYLSKEKKWATIQWTGRIGSDTVVDIVYDRDKPMDKRVVSPDEPPISRSMSLAEFVEQIGKNERDVERKPSKPKSLGNKSSLLQPPPPPSPAKVEMPSVSVLEDEVFDSHANESSNDSALEDDSETEDDSDDSDSSTDDDSETDDDSVDEDSADSDEKVMTPPPGRAKTPPPKKTTSMQNIVLYDDDLQKIHVDRSPIKENGKQMPKDEKQEEKPYENVDIQSGTRTKPLSNFYIKKGKKAPEQKQQQVQREEEQMKVSSLPRSRSNEKPKKGGGFFRRRTRSSDADEFARDSWRKKNRQDTLSESALGSSAHQIEVEQHLPSRDVIPSTDVESEADKNAMASISSADSDYYRPASPGIKDTGIQLSNAKMSKFMEGKPKKTKAKNDSTNKSTGSLSSFFKWGSRSSSREGKLDEMTTMDIDIEKDTQIVDQATEDTDDEILQVNSTSQDPKTEHTDQETEDSDHYPESKDDAVPVEHEVQKPKKGKSLISALFSRKPKHAESENETAESTEPSPIPKKKIQPDQDLNDENDPVSQNKPKKPESIKEDAPPPRRDSKGRSSFFSRKSKKPDPIQPVEKKASSTEEFIDDDAFIKSIESLDKEGTNTQETPAVVLRKPKKEERSSTLEGRRSSDESDKAKKENRNSFRNSFTRRFSLSKKRKNSSAEKDKALSLAVETEHPIKPTRPKSLYIKPEESKHKEINRTNSASALVDIQPWHDRREQKDRSLDFSFSSPVDPSGKNVENVSEPSNSVAPKPKKNDPDVPKHRIFTTPAWLTRKSKKPNAETEEVSDKKEEKVKKRKPKQSSRDNDETDSSMEAPPPFVEPPKPPVVMPAKKPKPVAPPVAPKPPKIVPVVPKQTVETPEEPQLVTVVPPSTPATSFIDVTEPTPSVVDVSPETAPPLHRIKAPEPAAPAPLIRLATPVGYGVKRPSSNATPVAFKVPVVSTQQVSPSLETTYSGPRSPPPLPASPPGIPQKTQFYYAPKPTSIDQQYPPEEKKETLTSTYNPPPIPYFPRSPPPSLLTSSEMSNATHQSTHSTHFPPPAMPPPLKSTSLVMKNHIPPQPVLSDLPLTQTITTPSMPMSPSPSPSPTSTSFSPRISFETEPTVATTTTMSHEAESPASTFVNSYMGESSQPSPGPIVGISTPYYENPRSPLPPTNVEIQEEETYPSLPSYKPPPPVTSANVSLSRTPSIDRPPPLPKAPPPNRPAAGPPVCITAPTPQTPSTPVVLVAPPAFPLKSAMKQRKEIDFIPRGLKVFDRVVWYNASTPVPGIVRRLYKDGTDKYTAVVKFDREGLQAPLTLVREGDAYEVTVEELVSTESESFSKEAAEEKPQGQLVPLASLYAAGASTPKNTLSDNDQEADDGLEKNGIVRTPSVQFKQPNVDQVIEPRMPSVTSSVGSMGEVTEDDPILPPAFVEEEIQIACGTRRGIQSVDDSNCLETILFSMFYTTNVFDLYMLFDDPNVDEPSTKNVKAALRMEIVKPLRETGYVGAQAMRNLRDIMQPLSPDLNSLSSSAEVMMFILFQRTLKLKQFITYSSDLSDYHHQILINTRDPSKCVTIQTLFETSLGLMDNMKLKMIPTPALILEMPRSNNKLVQYEAIIPNLSLNLGHLLENGPKLCLCGMVGKFECRSCIDQTNGSTSIVYCESCRGISDQIHHQLNHQPMLSPIIQMNGSMDLVAIICIHDGHYASFVKCGTDRLSPWLFFDSIANENPRVCVEQHLGMWLDRLEKHPGKYREGFVHSLLGQLLTDNHICIYHPRNRGSYV